MSGFGVNEPIISCVYDWGSLTDAIRIYRVSGIFPKSGGVKARRIKLNIKVIYHFGKFTIVFEIEPKIANHSEHCYNGSVLQRVGLIIAENIITRETIN